ncbi:hypothetical protein KFL_000350125 [Klebsormidium nitens]|uniref:Uncharacterized protein n=1 Tax=Klebsormidium nitens TaxID=105231 RepID=A0A1Y1HSW6_KLENI|nr:hypothetical protein KFL_000350125 [Klebsormidium nitens]|eukprot:GAQ79656.1 hypothetical protein KFL_000350125 [Klebsormidium nitens]
MDTESQSLSDASESLSELKRQRDELTRRIKEKENRRELRNVKQRIGLEGSPSNGNHDLESEGLPQSGKGNEGNDSEGADGSAEQFEGNEEDNLSKEDNGAEREESSCGPGRHQIEENCFSDTQAEREQERSGLDSAERTSDGSADEESEYWPLSDEEESDDEQISEASGEESLSIQSGENESEDWTPSDEEEIGEETLESEDESDLDEAGAIESDEEESDEESESDDESDDDDPFVAPLPIPVTPQLQAELQRLCATRIPYNGSRDSLREHCNFDLSTQGLPRAVLDPSVYVAHSPEQSNKTVGIAAISIFAHAVARPSVVLVKEVEMNAEGVCEKLKKIFQPFEMEALCLTGAKKGWRALSESPFKTGCVRDGRLVLVVPAYQSAINHCADFLRENHIRDVMLTMDEADNFFSNSWTRRTPRTGARCA